MLLLQKKRQSWRAVLVSQWGKRTSSWQNWRVTTQSSQPFHPAFHLGTHNSSLKNPFNNP